MDNIELMIRDALSNDVERFEAIYYYINDISYINSNVDLTPLHNTKEDFPAGHTRLDYILEYVHYLILKGSIECLSQNGHKFYNPNLGDFKEFSKFWLKLTDS